jgi:16S rRNA (adenine1518-N6/adenine1519-N6)-dimethyltransferase
MSGQTLKARISAALTAEGLKPLHRLGQNFMIEESAVAAMVTATAPAPGVRIVEVGPGTGVLTERFLSAGATVLAVELDQGLHGFLQRTLVPLGLQLVHGDALATKNRLHPAIEAFTAAGPWRLAANLPYDVALPVILDAVALPNPPEQVVVTIQKEAAQRLVSHPGDDAWGATAAVLQAAGTPRLTRHLSPACFFPQPRVDSAILTWLPERPLPLGFGRWCREVFAYRRKVLPGALRDAGLPRADAEAACSACGLDPQRRLEMLSPAELVALFQASAAARPSLSQGE